MALPSSLTSQKYNNGSTAAVGATCTTWSGEEPLEVSRHTQAYLVGEQMPSGALPKSE